MKKIIASAGMVALGATVLHAANYGDIAPEDAGKRWSVSAALRGFYDDNYTTRPSDVRDPVTGKKLKRDSIGFEVNPSLALNLPMETSFLGLTYDYTLAYYDDRDDNKYDQSHDLRLTFDHRFSERYRLNFQDQFVYSIEPTLLDQGGTVTVPLRADAEAIHNRAVLSFEAELTPVWSVLSGYENSYYDYQDDGDGSYSALLDRVEHLFRIDPRYNLSQNTTPFFGYQFGINNYLSSDLLTPGGTVAGEDRSSYSHYGYIGAEHKFSPVLFVAGRIGVQFITYSDLDQDETSPYLDVIGTYNYLPGSFANLGVKYARNGTDIAGGVTPEDLTLDQETMTVYLSAQHRITSYLSGGLLTQYQHSTYNGGTADGEADDYLSAALTLTYKINRKWSVEASYTLDHLISDLDGRDFTRNRVLAGVRGTY